MSTAQQLRAELEFALELADVADEISMRRWRAPDLVVEHKSDGSPVSDADKEIERALRARIERRRPTHAITGEEGGAGGESDHRWYLDPIDGTGRYVVGDPEWYSLIGLVVAGETVLGVASAPALGERWWAARGTGAFRNGERLHVSGCASLQRATVTDDWDQTLARGITDHPLVPMAAAAGRVRPHNGHADLVIASGAADIAIGIGGGSWDYAPTKAIVEEAGGRFTDLYGNDSFDGGHALVTNGNVHDAALRVLEELRADPGASEHDHGEG